MNVPFLRKFLSIVMVALLVVPLANAQQVAPAPQPQSGANAPAASQAGEPSLESRPSAGQDAGDNQQPAQNNKPVGTATAPYEKASGVTASRPAGAVIAPAKQHRARTIFIRVGIIVGAAAAIGAVAALSHSSPSTPH